MRYAKLIPIAVLAIFLLALPGAASAKYKDRNHDRISDRWERAHHLTLRVNQARRDQDHDGLKNRGEFRAQTDPRDDDSDNDGVEDGDERAGTVTAFDGTKLTVTLFAGGDEIKGMVTPETEIECDPGDDDVNEQDGDNNQREDGDDNDERALRHDDGEGDEQGDDEGDDENDGESCPPGALKEGAIVQEAELKLGSAGAVFEKIELLVQ